MAGDASHPQYLFFDTETTGLPRFWRASVHDVDNWPRLVQLAWVLTDSGGQEAAAGNRIIVPDGFRIPGEAAAIHGITTARAERDGVPLDDALAEFAAAVEQAAVLVAHNISFDEMVVGAEFVRRGVPSALHDRPKVCTMQSSTDFCRLPGGRGYKWPRLAELHQTLFRTGFEHAHDALADVRACARCYFALVERGVL